MDIQAIYKGNFWRGKLGYFGRLRFLDTGSSFEGQQKGLTKTESINMQIPLPSIKEIVLGRRTVRIVTQDITYEFNISSLYNADGLDLAGSFGLAGALINV